MSATLTKGIGVGAGQADYLKKKADPLEFSRTTVSSLHRMLQKINKKTSSVAVLPFWTCLADEWGQR